MSRYKNHRITPRNWDVLVDLDDADIPLFEPIRAFRPPEEDAKPRRVPRIRQGFHRPRFG